MLWGDFLLRRIRRELALLLENAPILGLGAFLCCFGGILLWVNGGSGWYLLRRAGERGMPGLTASFLLWLCAYGLIGMALAMIALADRLRCLRRNLGLPAFALGAAAYLLMLLWYVLFFCTHLTLLSVLLLLLSLALVGMLLIVTKRTFLALSVCLILVEAVQFFFLIRALMYYFC